MPVTTIQVGQNSTLNSCKSYATDVIGLQRTATRQQTTLDVVWFGLERRVTRNVFNSGES